jgi:hexosaminidase
VQLIKASKENEGLFEVPHVPIVIQDSPRYPYRGLMLDTSRRFYSVEGIKQVIDSMAAAKYNVLHWHLVDDDSFPMTLDSFPSLVTNAAFSADRVYSKA